MKDLSNKKLNTVLGKVFELESQRGHLKWSVAELARKSDIGRTSLYYHFGKSKNEILFSCLDIVASEYYGLNEGRTDAVRKGNLLESLMHTRKLFLKTPELSIFYTKWINKKSDIQKKLLDIDHRYQQRLQALFPHLNAKQLIAIQAIFSGLASAPSINEDIIKEALSWLPLKQ